MDNELEVMLKQPDVLNKHSYQTFFFLNSINLIEFKFLKKKFIKELKFFYLIKKKTLSSLINFFKVLNKNHSIKPKKFKANIFIFKKKFINLFKLKFKFFFKPLNNELQLNFIPDSLPFCELLKTNKIHHLNLKNIINSFGYIYIKSSGINTFITLTNSLGNV